MNKIGNLLKIALGISFLGFVFRMLLIPTGGTLNTLGLSFASILTLIQFKLSLSKIENNKKLKVFSALISLVFSICFIGILCRYQWWNWRIHFFIGTPLFIIFTVIFLVLQNEFMNGENKGYVLRNIALPLVFVFVFGTIPLIMSNKQFYNTFSYRRQTMTYEEFLDKVAHVTNNE